MLTSVRGPMLGTHTGDRWGARLRRHDRPCASWGRLQKRAARTTERELWEADVADEAIENDDPRTNDYWGHLLDLDAWRDELVRRDEDDEFEPVACGCYCRRCVLHDDHGGCSTPWEHARGIVVAS